MYEHALAAVALVGRHVTALDGGAEDSVADVAITFPITNGKPWGEGNGKWYELIGGCGYGMKFRHIPFRRCYSESVRISSI